MGWNGDIDKKYFKLLEEAADGNEKSKERLEIDSHLQGIIRKKLNQSLYSFQIGRNQKQSDINYIQCKVISILIEKMKKAQQQKKGNPFLKNAFNIKKGSVSEKFYLNLLIFNKCTLKFYNF